MAIIGAGAGGVAFRTAGGAPIFASIRSQLAREAVLTDMSWEKTVDAWISSRPT